MPEQAQRTVGWHDLICEMVGDVQRMIDYPGLGFQVAQRIPATVVSACQALRDRGFDNPLR